MAKPKVYYCFVKRGSKKDWVRALVKARSKIEAGELAGTDPSMFVIAAEVLLLQQAEEGVIKYETYPYSGVFNADPLDKSASDVVG